VTRASQDWVEENVTGKTKSPTSDERWEDPGLVFWGEGNGPVTLDRTTWVWILILVLIYS